MSQKPYRAFSEKVIRRALGNDDAAFDAWYAKYLESRILGSTTGMDRAVSLSIPTTPEEVQLLTSYLFDNSKSVSTLATEQNLTSSKVQTRVARTALRFLAQNKDKFNL